MTSRDKHWQSQVKETGDQAQHLLIVQGTARHGKSLNMPDMHITCPSDGLLRTESAGPSAPPQHGQETPIFDTIEVTFSDDFSLADGADAIVYHGPDAALMPPFVSPMPSSSQELPPPPTDESRAVPIRLINRTHPSANSRVNVWHSEEPPWASNGVEVSDPRHMAEFSVFAGFHPNQLAGRSSQICYNAWGLGTHKNTTLFGPRGQYWSDEIIPFSKRRKDFDSAWVHRKWDHCKVGQSHQGAPVWGLSRRTEVVQKLSTGPDGGRVARLGECMHNVDFPTSTALAGGAYTSMRGVLAGSNKAELEDASLRYFKFLLTFENQLCGFYMSEKIWKAFALGLVPVVMASAEAEAMLPARDAFISVRSFDTVYHLKKFLKDLAQDEVAYMKYFDWKSRPLHDLSPGFQDLWRDSPYEEFLCCMARGVVHAQADFHAGRLPPPIPGLECNSSLYVHGDGRENDDWNTFLQDTKSQKARHKANRARRNEKELVSRRNRERQRAAENSTRYMRGVAMAIVLWLLARQCRRRGGRLTAFFLGSTRLRREGG